MKHFESRTNIGLYINPNGLNIFKQMIHYCSLVWKQLVTSKTETDRLLTYRKHGIIYT